MKRIYNAANNIEAHMLSHLLQQAGIDAHVEGEHLQSGVGELPAGGLAAVVVDDDDAIRARKIIEDWEKQSPPPATDAAASKSMRGPIAAFVIGAALSGLSVWSIYSGPLNEEGGIDYDGDGRVDEHYFYRSNTLERFEADRNRDGKVDDIVEYDRRGIARTERRDDNFDGYMDATSSFSDGTATRFERDDNSDGRAEYREEYQDGVITLGQYFNVETGKPAKRVYYRDGKPERAELDLDGDGVFEMSYRYGLYDEARPN